MFLTFIYFDLPNEFLRLVSLRDRGGGAIEVHRNPGHKLMESIYSQRLAHELKLQGIAFFKQHPLPVGDNGLLFDCGYRVDILEQLSKIISEKRTGKRHFYDHP